MASRYSIHPHIWQRLSRGPLGPSADALVALLVEQGYCPHRIAAVRAALAVHCVTQLGRSLAETAPARGLHGGDREGGAAVSPLSNNTTGEVGRVGDAPGTPGVKRVRSGRVVAVLERKGLVTPAEMLEEIKRRREKSATAR